MERREFLQGIHLQDGFVLSPITLFVAWQHTKRVEIHIHSSYEGSPSPSRMGLHDGISAQTYLGSLNRRAVVFLPVIERTLRLNIHPMKATVDRLR